MDLPVGEPRLVHYEEAEYRTKPAWMPNGSNLLYVSDESRANDIAVVPLSGGNPIHLTVDSMHEYSPSPNPTGDRFAFVSNRSGPTVLYTVAAGGGPFPSWTEVPLTSRRARIETGMLRISVQDDGGGAAMPARVQVLASDGRAYTPDGSYHRVIAATETHYFHTPGASELEVPAGRVRVEALRGHEYVPDQAEVAVPAGGVAEVTLTLARLIDLPALGIYSGDTHIHDLHQGRFGLTHEQFYGQLLAEDLHVTNALIHMDGTHLMGRWDDLTGAPHQLSSETHILQYGEEYRGSLGHIAMLGIERYILPLIGGAGGTAFGQPELEFRYLDGAREQGGIAGFVHPYLGSVARPTALSNSLIPLDVALGRGDFYDVVALYSDEFNSTEIYYRLLNCGFRIAATGGTDNFSDVWRDPPPGTDRTYVRIDGPLSFDAWMQGIRDQRTFGSTGPILLLDVEGREPGDEIALAGDAPTSLRLRAEAVSIAPMDQLEIIVNGQIARTVDASDSLHIEFEGTVEVPVGGWIAARASGPSSRYVTDSYAFAQTSPVYIVRDGRRFASAGDARFFIEAIDALWARVADADWRTAEERERFRAAVEAAREVYESIEAEAQARSDRFEG